MGQLRIGTWNVEHARGRTKNDLRRRLLLGRDADVWVLTETHDDLDLPSPYIAIHGEPRSTSDPGGRWVTLWSRLPLVERLVTIDPSRSVAARLRSPDGLELVVYGTVLPWMHDRTADPVDPRPAWSEFYRVTDEQGAEWHALRRRFPEAVLVVAGDLNHNLGGRHYYGTNRGRAQLRAALASADLRCLTEAERLVPDQLEFPPIDHVCAAPPVGADLRSTVEGWEKTTDDGTVLTDHSGVLAEIAVVPGAERAQGARG